VPIVYDRKCKTSVIILHKICIPGISDVALFLADVFLTEEPVSDVAEGGLSPAVGSFGVWICN
jgi:hypothetical protein